jgi:hypothetical protein
LWRAAATQSPRRPCRCHPRPDPRPPPLPPPPRLPPPACSPRGDPNRPEFKDFLPLPKPAHLVYIKPTVAVVTDVAARSSVGLKMTIGDNKLERYVVEFFSRKL